MLRNLRICSWKSQINFCRARETVSKLLINFRECHRSGIFDDEDWSDEKPRTSPYGRNSRQRAFDGNEDWIEEKPRSSHFERNARQRDFDSDEGDFRFRRSHQFRDRGFQNRYPFDEYRSKKFTSSSFGQNLLNSSPSSETWKQKIEKYFYNEHPDVAQMSKEEVIAYRESMNITVRGSDVPNPIKSFDQLSLPDGLKKINIEHGYSEPTPIQAQGWPIVLSGRDMVGISQTGSGKTLIFALPAIIHAMNQPVLDSRRNDCQPQVLILAPTRELVQQILQVTDKYSHSCGLYTGCAYGGASKNNQLRVLRGAHICVATPGRLIDFVSEGTVSLQKCTFLVLDEADRMLDMGFEPQIRKLVKQIRPDRQTVMFSATWPREIQDLAEDFLTNYIQVTIGSGDLMANPNIKQNIYLVDEFKKKERFVSLLQEIMAEGGKVLVFAQTKRKVDYLNEHLRGMRIPSLHIHGDVSQSRRDQVLHSFRNKKSCVLIATDVAARGLDITDIQHVINYDMPPTVEDYIHRIGRTARGSSSGHAHSFFTEENVGLARDLVAVLDQAKQEVDPELFSMASKRFKRNSFRSRGGYERGFQYN